MTHWIDVLCAVVWRFDGSVIAHPSELASDGREACPEWLRLGWPATGTSLVKLLTAHADELRGMGVLVHHTPPGEGQPEWIAVTNLDAPPRVHPRLPAEAMVPLARNRGRVTPGPRPTV